MEMIDKYTEQQVNEILVVFMWYLLSTKCETFKQIKGDKFQNKARTIIETYNSFSSMKERIDNLIDNNHKS